MTSTAAEISIEQADKLVRDFAAVVERLQGQADRVLLVMSVRITLRERQYLGPGFLVPDLEVFEGSDCRSLVTPERGGFRVVTQNARTLASDGRTAVQAVIDG
ncbi:hypothetical protein [Nonomuraea sp. NPDC003754]